MTPHPQVADSFDIETQIVTDGTLGTLSDLSAPVS